MANYAYTENNEVVEVYDYIPKNWKNYSNFFVLENDTDFLNSIGWYKIVFKQLDYNPEEEKLGKIIYYLNEEEKIVYETREVIDLTEEEKAKKTKTDYELQKEAEIENIRIEKQWNLVRINRDKLMKDNDWRYSRHQRELRLGLVPTENLEDIDNYMQELANITTQEDPFMIFWPNINISEEN
jgi:hypothetical protein